MSADRDKTRCRCGVWKSAHDEGRGCGNYRQASRLQLWRMDHGVVRHVVGALWLKLPEKARWDAVHVIYKLRPHLCWCDLVDAAYLDIKADDYRKPNGCGCHVPLPTDARRPRYGFCYCQPKEVSA